MTAAPATRIEPLGRHHDRAAFSCGTDQVDAYFRTHAGQDQRRRLAAVFVMVDVGTGGVAGFYALSSLSVAAGDLPDALVRRTRLPGDRDVPATLIGQFGIDRRFQGRGFGEHLLMSALDASLRASLQVASFAVVVDAVDEPAKRFWRRYHFIPFRDRESRLFLPMSTVAQMFD